jgi:predicted DsbA family dithiol-disulfide isomerase
MDAGKRKHEEMLRYYFDVVCPYSYLLMPEVEAAEDAGTPVEWVPFELRPAPAELPEPRGEYIRDHWRDHVYPLALAYGIEIHVPVYQPRSTLALTAGLWAQDEGAGRAWRNGVQRAFFVVGDDAGDERTLRRVARECRLSPDDAVAAAWDPALQARLRTIRDDAMAIAVHGVPALAVDDELVFFGAPGPGTVAAALDGWDGDAVELAARLRSV